MEPLVGGDPKRIGPYYVRGRLGSGAMGQVYLGETRDRRRAAVKLLRAEFAASPEFRRRFARESEAAKRVGGPRTAQVLDADAEAARPWIATEYLPGPTLLAHVAAHGPLPPDAVASLAGGLAQGLAAVHACGLVHRDLKPGNVILTEHGPVIIDFGIAHAVDASTLTATGTVLGTYGYMAPEQITADAAAPASDVFGLGCVLAFAANGTGPFDATTVPAIIHRVLAEPPELGALTGDLRDLAAACLAKDPADRPDLAEVIARCPAPAPAPTRIDPLAGGFAPGRVDAPTEVAGGPPARPRRRIGRRALLTAGLAVVGAGAAGLAWRQWSERHRLDELGASTVRFSPDGTRLVAGGGELGGRLWDVASREVVTDLADDPSSVRAIAFSPDGGSLVTAGAGSPVTFRDPATGGVTRTLPSPFEDVYWIEFSPDGTRIALGGGCCDTPCVVWDAASGEPAETVFPESQVYALFGGAFAEGGASLLLAGAEDTEADHGFWRWDFASGELAALGPGGGSGFEAVAGQDGGFVLAGDTGVWLSLGGGEPLPLTAEYSTAAAFSPDGSTLATAGDSGIRLWDGTTGLAKSRLKEGGQSSMAFSPDGALLAAGSTYAGEGGCWLWPIEA